MISKYFRFTYSSKLVLNVSYSRTRKFIFNNFGTRSKTKKEILKTFQNIQGKTFIGSP